MIRKAIWHLKKGVRRGGPLLLPVLGLQMGAAGAGDDPFAEQAFFAPIPTVASATRLEKSTLEAGVSVTIIDREMIEASTALEIPDLLRLVPGFQVANATGAVMAAAYHGAADQWPRRMEVMVDGRSVYLSTNSNVEWSALGLAIEDIERIEVVRGPNAPTFGSNAVLGSINIITRPALALAGKYLRGTVGSQETGIGVARLGTRIGGWDTSLTAQYRQDEGFDRVDDHKRLTDLRLRGDYDATALDTVSVQLGLTSGEVGADGTWEITEPFRDRDIRSHYEQASWTRSEPGGSRYWLNFYHQYFNNDDGYELDLAPGVYLPLGLYVGTTERYDLEFQHNLEPMNGWRLAWGVGGRYDKLSSDLMLGERGEVDKYSGRLFGSLEWKPLDQLLLSLDALTEAHESYGTETSPRVGATWLPTPSRSFRASASRSYRVFTLLERYIDYPLVASNGAFLRQLFITYGHDDFTPERVTGYEVGYTERWDDLGLLLDLRLFHDRLDDAGIGALMPNRTTLWRDEGGGWKTRGFEAQLDYRPTPDTRLVGAYSYAEIDGRLGSLLDQNGNIIAYDAMDDTVPTNTLSLLLSHRFTPQWTGSLVLYHMGDTRWRGEGSEVDAYTRLDLKLARDVRLGGGEGQVGLIVQNLTGDEYDDFRVPGTYKREGNVFDRRAYLQVRLQFD